jgi:hypothetical protein
MFDDETVNAFSGGYKISEPGVITLIGLPPVSNIRSVISVPISISIDALVRTSDRVVWRGNNIIEIPYRVSKLTNDWYDPIKLVTNISVQRGWKKAPYILADERLNYHLSLGYYSAFVDLLVQSFSLVNDINLSTSEIIQMSGEVQDRIKGGHYAYETLTRQEGKEGNILFYDLSNDSFKNEIVDFEPYSLFLISENSLSSNEGFKSFHKNFTKFNDGRMLRKETSTLSYPFVGIKNHIVMEEEKYNQIVDSLKGNDIVSFVENISTYSQSLGYNLGVISEFQRNMAKLLEKYEFKTYIFNVGEYSGSVLIFADSLELARIRDNVIRDYYNLTNRTVRFDDVRLSGGSRKERIRV